MYKMRKLKPKEHYKTIICNEKKTKSNSGIWNEVRIRYIEP